MKQQTAIQELIQEFEELKKTKLYKESFKAIDDCILLALNKLDREKKQLENAYIHDMTGGSPFGFQQYFTENFKK